MHSKAERKEANKKFKERETLRGVFALRCTATGQVWVGPSRNLAATKNSLWFRLRNGIYPDQILQKEWSAHGEQAFQYEILEKLDDDLLPLELTDLLKEKKRLWIAQLGAQPLA